MRIGEALHRPWRAQPCREEEDEGGGDSAFVRDYDLYLYLLLDPFRPETSEAGAAMIRVLRDFDRASSASLSIRRPYSGSETKFREEVLSVLKAEPPHRAAVADRLGVFVAAKELGRFDEDIHRCAFLDFETLFTPEGAFLSGEAVTALKALAKLEGGKLLDALQARKAQRRDWLSAVEWKVGLYGVTVDMKKLFEAARGGTL